MDTDTPVSGEIIETEPSYASDRSPLLGPNHSNSDHVIFPSDTTANARAYSHSSMPAPSTPSMATTHTPAVPVPSPPPTPPSPSLPVLIPRASPNRGSRGQTNTPTPPVDRRRLGIRNPNILLSIELVITLSQIIASVVVLSISWDDTPQAPLDAWIIGYAAGCLATLPLLYWRYTHRYVRRADQPPDNPVTFSSRVTLTPPVTNSPPTLMHPAGVPSATGDGGGGQDAPSAVAAGPSRIDDPRILRGLGVAGAGGVPSLETVIAMDGQQRLLFSRLHDDTRMVLLVERFKILLDCFFAVWFVMGNVWIFGGGRDSARESHSLYWLCVVFLIFSCIGYAMPFILCATICCCLPCIIALMGYTDEPMEGKGAAQETITRLPIYKFKSNPVEGASDAAGGAQRAGAGRRATASIGSDDCRGSGKDSDSDNDSTPMIGGFLVDASTKKAVSAEDAMCCICLGRYVDGVELRGLPCDHHFHVACVDTWLKINAICPLCKNEIVAQDASGIEETAQSGSDTVRIAVGGDGGNGDGRMAVHETGGNSDAAAGVRTTGSSGSRDALGVV